MALLNHDQELFAVRVASHTGLDLGVVTAWVLAEGGPPDNPLNIGPGRHYGSWLKAADATVQLLHTSIYAPIMRAAHGAGGIKTQLAAIVNSPWDAGHYRKGVLLRGTYARVQGEWSKSGGRSGVIGGILHAGESLGDAIVSGPEIIAGGPKQAAEKAADIAGSVPEAIVGATKYVVGKAELGFVYVALTAVAVALVLLGLVRAFGVSPTRFVPGAPVGAGSSQGGEIPF